LGQQVYHIHFDQSVNYIEFKYFLHLGPITGALADLGIDIVTNLIINDAETYGVLSTDIINQTPGVVSENTEYDRINELRFFIIDSNKEVKLIFSRSLDS